MTTYSFPGLIELSAEWLPLILLLGKLTLLLVVAWLLHAMLWKQNPRWRVLLWRATALSIPLVIGLQLAPAFIHWPVLPTEFAQRPAPEDTQATVTAPQAESPRSNQLHTDFGIPNDAVPAEHSPQSPSGSAQFAPPAVHADSSDGLLPAANGSNGPAANRATVIPAAFTKNTVALCLLLVWALVFLSLLGSTLLAQRWLTRLVRRSQPAPPHVLAIYRETAEQLSFCQAVTVLHSDEVRSPCVAGIFRPVILLPSPQCAAQRAAELPAILAHELAHLRQHDLIWNTLLHGISLLLWFQPLCWRMRAAHALACDGVADAVAADHVGDVSSYSRTLARLAVDYHNPALAATMGMSRASHIRCRIERLNRRLFRQSLSRRNTAIALLLGLLVTLTVGNVAITAAEPEATQDSAATAASQEFSNVTIPELGDRQSYSIGQVTIQLEPQSSLVTSTNFDSPDETAGEEPEPIPATDAPRKEARLEIRAVTDDGQAVPGVKLAARGLFGDEEIKCEAVTDDQGVILFSYPAETVVAYFAVEGSREGYVPFSQHQGTDEQPVSLPDRMDVTMARAEKIQGTVLNTRGKPLAGARVWLSIDNGRHLTAIPGAVTTTDAAGRWSWPAAPQDLYNVQINFSSAGYTARYIRGVQDRETLITLEPAQNTVVGRVTDSETGKPIPWASVRTPLQGSTTFTDDQGQFYFNNLNPGDVTVSVQASGYSEKRTATTVKEREPLYDLGDIPLSRPSADQE